MLGAVFTQILGYAILSHNDHVGYIKLGSMTLVQGSNEHCNTIVL